MKIWLIFLVLVSSFYAKGSQNLFLPCRHGLEMLEWNLECIKHAEQSIEMFLCIAGGKTFQKILLSSEERMKVCKDIQVYVLVSPVLLFPEDIPLIERLERQYPHNFHFRTTISVPSLTIQDYCLNDLHLKGIIVDETYFSIGGTNFHDFGCTEGTFTPHHDREVGEEIFPIGMRDYDIIGKGPIAKELRNYFYKQFALWDHFDKNPRHFISDPEYFADKSAYQNIDPEKPIAYVPLIDRSQKAVYAEAYIVFSGPSQPQLIGLEYAKLINQAQHRVDIANFFSTPCLEILTAIKKAVCRDVQFSIITNGLHEQSPYMAHFFYMAHRIHYVPFFTGHDYSLFERKKAEKDLKKNTTVYEYQVPKVALHKKIMVVDKRFLVIGSYNLGKRSHLYDYEGILVVDSEDIAAHALEVLEEDKKFSEKISSQMAMDWYFNPFLFYLGTLQKQYNSVL